MREKEVKSPLLLPDTTPEPKSSSSAEGEVVYSMLPDPDTEGAGGQSPDQQRAGTEPPTQAEGEDMCALSPVGRPPASWLRGPSSRLRRRGLRRAQTRRLAVARRDPAGRRGPRRAVARGKFSSTRSSIQSTTFAFVGSISPLLGSA